MPMRRHAPFIIFPDDPSHEELLQRRFAVQLWTLRAYGRFVPEATPAPGAITNYLA